MDSTDETRLAAIQARLTDDWPAGEGVECVPGRCGGAPVLVGTRWPVIIWHQCYESYGTPEATDAAVAYAYDWLTPEQIATARAYCLANQLHFMARREFNHQEADVVRLYRDDIAYLLTLVKTPAESARLAALAAWDDEQHRFYHDAALVPGSARWEEQYATQAVLWGRLLRLLEAQREGAGDDDNG